MGASTPTSPPLGPAPASIVGGPGWCSIGLLQAGPFIYLLCKKNLKIQIFQKNLNNKLVRFGNIVKNILK